jgi:ribose transport system ATP-binding protein
MTVAENIAMGREPLTRLGLIDYVRMNQEAMQLLVELSIDLDVTARVAALSTPERQSVQIARALARDAKVFILDEPTASYSTTEIERLLSLVRSIARRGVGVIYISHHLEEVFAIHDRITVLRDGKKVATHGKNEVGEQVIISEMVGRDLSLFYPREMVSIDHSRSIEFRGFSGGPVQDVSFKIHKGEIVGLAGMVGSGRTDLVKLIYGAAKKTGGSMLIEGKAVEISSPQQAVAAGLCLLTEDRQKTGLILTHSVKWNATLAHTANSAGAWIDERAEVATVKGLVSQIGIRTPHVDQEARFLSGGNQQKVVLAKWLLMDARLLIFDEPTRGIDIGAKAEIYRLMVQLAREGKYILMVSSDMPELIAMCDRVLVMRKGSLVGEVERADLREETILAHSIGGRQ